MKKGASLVFLLMCGNLLAKEPVNLLNDSLEGFLGHMTQDESEQREFRGFYSKFLRKQGRYGHHRIRGKLQNLRLSALSSIELKNPPLYKEIEPFLIDLDFAKDCRNIRLFLTRYALFEEYKRRKAIKTSGMWERFKDGVKRFAHRVRSSFKGEKKKRVSV